MKKNNPWQKKSKTLKIWQYILLGLILFIIVVIGSVLLTILFFEVVTSLCYQQRPYEVHHPAIYYVQEDFFQLDDKVYYMNDDEGHGFYSWIRNSIYI